MFHFGVNDPQRNRNQSEAVDELILNLKKTATRACVLEFVKLQYRVYIQ